MTAIRFRNRKCEQIVSKTGDKCLPVVKGIPITVKRPNVAEAASSRLDVLKQQAMTVCEIPLAPDPEAPANKDELV